MKRRSLKVIGLLSVGIVIILLIFNIIGFDKIITSLAELNLYYYLIVIALIAGGSILWAMRWGVFVRRTNPEVPSIDLIKMMLVGQSVNNLTPVVKMGGELTRVYLLKKKFKMKAKESFATIASDLTMEFIVDGIIVFMALLFLLIFMTPPSWIFGMILIFALVSSLIVFVILDIYYDLAIVNKIVVLICKYIKSVKESKDEILKMYEDFRKGFRTALQDKKIFSKTLTLSFMRKAFEGMKYFFLLTALGHQIGFISIFIAVGLSITLLLIPGIPGNIGIYEGGMVAVFIFLGVPSGAAATAVFLDRLVWYWGITATGGILGTKYGLDLLTKKKAEDV